MVNRNISPVQFIGFNNHLGPTAFQNFANDNPEILIVTSKKFRTREGFGS